MEALILVDIQTDFLPGGALAVPDGDVIIPVVNALIPLFPLVVATQDWHPQGHLSFASAHAGKKPFDVINLEGLQQVLWSDHCVQGTPGAALNDAIQCHKIEAIFRKGTDSRIDSYSGFYDNGHIKPTGLSGYLKTHAVNKVFVVGLAADYCVYYTALDALKEGFEACVVEDATKPISEEGFEKAKKDLMDKGAIITHSKMMFQ